MSTDRLRDDIANFHEYGLYPPTKTLEIFGEIDDQMKTRVIKNLHAMDSMSGMITILLSSEGGCVSSGLDIYDAIRASKNHVRIIAYGGVESMASVVFQAADPKMRFMTPNSYIMVHEGEQETKGSFKNRKSWEKLIQHQEDICNNIYLSNIKEKKPKYTMDKFKREFLDHDRILLPQEAIDLGLADTIIEIY
jgi:ATP-dependent protease ClpP protease subunit